MADSDEEPDVEFVGQEDIEETSDVEFIFEEKNHQFVISDSEDEVEEVISDEDHGNLGQQAGNQNHAQPNDDVHMGENGEEPEDHVQEENLVENEPNQNRPGSSQSQRNNGLDDGESEPEVGNTGDRPASHRNENGRDADDEDEENLPVGDLPHHSNMHQEDSSVPSSSKPTKRHQAWRETIELSSSDEDEPNPFARTARRPEFLSQKNLPRSLIPERKAQKRPLNESDEPSSSKKPNISSSVDSNKNLHSHGTRDCQHEAGPSEASSSSSFIPSSRVNNSKTPANANQRHASPSDSESNNEEMDQPNVGAILISDSEEEQTEPIRESNIQSPIIIL